MRRFRGDILVRSCDIVLSLAELIIAAPAAFIALFMAIVAFGRPFYAARRVGRHGKAFLHIKIRTMKAGRVFARAYLEKDRIPPMFAVVRTLRLDEYPDLIRILCGDMSFVGSRPLPQKVIDTCLSVPSADRHELRPGLTGLAQLALVRRGFISSETQFALDAAWTRRASFRLYLGILAATIPAVKNGRKPLEGADANAYRKRQAMSGREAIRASRIP